MAEKPETDPLIGTMLGPCRIESFIGRGGMGNVYKARHIALDREVAVKIIEPPMMNGEAVVNAVLQEARAAAKLEDPRIVQVYDAGQQGPFCYIVMQLMRGETLERLFVRRGLLGQTEALKIMREVVLALGAAHRSGIVHRDVKPGNIMIDEAGQVRIMDFGISAGVGSDSMQMAGSVDFMAPEQAFGARPDPRSDLYAVGVVYFLLLTGKLPYPAASPADAMLKHREAPVPDVRELDSGVPRFAAGLIMKLMAKNPEQRPRDAEEVLKALDDPDMLRDVDPRPDAGKGHAPLPPPPPALPERPVAPPLFSKAIFIALLALAFGPGWRRAVHADWLACGLVCGGSLAFLYLRGTRGWQRKCFGVALFVLMCLGFWKFGLPGAGFAPPRTPSVELFIVLGLGLAAGLGSAWQGLFDPHAENKDLPLGLLAVAALALLPGCASMALPPGAGVVSGLPRFLAAQAREFAGAGGPWRWVGFVVFYLGTWIFFPVKQEAAKRFEGRVIGYV